VQSMSRKRVIIGADHGGYAMKEVLKKHLSQNYDVDDIGTHNGATVDYPDVASDLCHKFLSDNSYVGGILICGSGIGISIAANKVDGIRCALCHDHYSAKMSRKHNNANVLAMGGRNTGEEVAKEMVDTWLAESFDGAHHVNRIQKIHSIEKK